VKNIKDITILIFAIIGFYAIVTGFTKEEQITTPESHMTSESNSTRAFSVNKLTGEVRQHRTNSYTMGAKNQYKTFATHRVSSAK
jgi:hypothetical protein